MFIRKISQRFQYKIMAPVFHYWRTTNQFSKYLILRKAHDRMSNPETYDIKTRGKLSAQPGLSN